MCGRCARSFFKQKYAVFEYFLNVDGLYLESFRFHNDTWPIQLETYFPPF
ncbi:hypothetical protein HanRHA438_Chr11g0530691 [Helianthus annuus]|nr:hypothetical protein HanRHA438_Chr11g0530691 [Helianthus annuus]